MRFICLILLVFVSSQSSIAQDDDRIRDEVEDERIADEAEDLELVSEFEELEKKTAVAWKPALAMRGAACGGEGEGLLVPFKIQADGTLVAVWPTPGDCPQTATYGVQKIVLEQQTRTETYTVMTQETRTRTVEVTKCKVETRTRTVEVPRVDDDGNTLTETVEQTYQVQVPYTEQIEQTYTVMVPVTKTREVSVTMGVPVTELVQQTVMSTCFNPVLSRIEPGTFPIFRGDRRPALWEDFVADVSSADRLYYIAAFQKEDDWGAEWDTVLDPTSYVVILDSVDNPPEPIPSEPGGPITVSMSEVHSLPLLARRSDYPEHQYAFSPYVKANSKRPDELARQPVLPSTWFTDNGMVDYSEKKEWVYEIEMKEPLWTAVDGKPVTLLEVERTLSADDYFIVAPPAPPRSAWNDVFAERIPVYGSENPVTATKQGMENIRRQIELSFAAERALKRNDGAAVIDLVSKVGTNDIVDTNFLCQAAYLLHRQNFKDMAQAFVARALELDPSPLDRQRLIRSQGYSRVWLEQTVQDFPLQAAKKSRLNNSRMARMSAIYNRVMRGRELSPEQVDLLKSKQMKAFTPDAIPEPPAPVAQPAR